MQEFKVYLGLKNGEKFTFLTEAESDKQIISEIIIEANYSWYSFTAESVKYQVRKEDIVSIGISMDE
ncbi:hypothetical protein [Bacillus suaedae]|uniref:Uncharacterized protein n=1 Tax=Halalkalibacter suaedae TaxID=2822140 RepID=A0A940X0K6_9BACI|nr:hypothetical protein [Bacillus suaedae]MBP3952950.1 hypothetical protein [Bacillus suaedae]